MMNRRFGAPRMVRGRMRFAMRSAMDMLGGGGETGAGGGGSGGDAGAGGGGGQQQQQQQQQQQPAGDPWYTSGLTTDDDRAWMQNKGYGSLEDTIKAHRSLETKLGAGRFSVPTDWNDPTQAAAAYKALGVPEQMGDAYKVTLPDGVDGAFATTFAEKAHARGLLPHQWQGIAADYMEAEQAAATAAAAEAQRVSAADVAALKGAAGWGADFEKNDAIAGAAAKAFGLDVPALAKAMGTRGVLTFLYDLGKKTGEDGIDGGGARGLGNMTGAAAADAKKTFMADAEKTAKLRAKDPATVQEWQNINAAIAAEMDRAAAV